MGAAADQNLLVDTRATGHLLSAPQGLNHFLSAARQAAAEVIVLDPLYSTHDQDENDTRCHGGAVPEPAAPARCFRAALIVVHHVRKSIGRDEIGSAFRGSSALHAVGDSYLLLTRPSPHLPPPSSCASSFATPRRSRRACSNSIPQTLWFSAAGQPPATAAARRKVEAATCTQALAGLGGRLAITNCASKS